MYVSEILWKEFNEPFGLTAWTSCSNPSTFQRKTLSPSFPSTLMMETKSSYETSVDMEN